MKRGKEGASKLTEGHCEWHDVLGEWKGEKHRRLLQDGSERIWRGAVWELKKRGVLS